jgi:PAS domain S-box-containing protein
MTDEAKVLVVDDEPRNLDALEVMLEDLGATIIRAGSADDALLMLLQHEFAAIVLDIRMPGMDGIELARLIKQRRRLQHVPILFLTAHMVDEQDLLVGYGAGAVDYLSKPLNPAVLRSKVSGFIDLYRKSQALVRLNDALQSEIGERERAQTDLRRINQDLEARVQERTAALVRAHKGVRDNEERLRLALEVARMAAWEWNLATGRMTWSTDPEMLFGFPPGTFGVDRRIIRVLHPDDKTRVESAIQAALTTGIYDVQYRAVRPDGRIVWITDRGRVLPGDDGSFERIVGVSRDVTTQRESEHERERLLLAARQARDEAERQSRLKDEFLATVSHELRTPMNMVLGWVDILLSGKPIRSTSDALAVIQRNAQLQAKLIDDLLDMNRLMTGNMRLEVAPFDLGAVLRSTLQGLQPAADARHVEIEIVPTGTAASDVMGDSRRIQQVLWNLVHNAIKFSSAGGRVLVRLDQQESRVRLAVEDNGRGISPTFLPHVFERFRQEDASSSREATGLGLGLSIAKHLVELHGGTINAHSDGLDRGATFVVELPACAANGAISAAQSAV